ncbi:MAG TPA: outer membrane protein assembly factor BamD [Candidatus Saccharimonadales bacterium]|jgi:outer membrane protein assembly factor BamD|nr:outer membrane protein assembly factor BamD [Candidatus Saccharimonadales bacterium]
MLQKKLALILLAASLLLTAGCRHNKVVNPIANVDSKQPDKVLFDRALDSMKRGKYTEARSLLETMINAYPDSEFIARAKLGLGDSWYNEGGSAALQQAEAQYKDFITFFPNLPEAAEAQLKVADIHYKQMEKPDRDYRQAVRAEDEFKQLLQQFPDSKLAPEAKQRLRDVQEILAERQWRIAHFYLLRDNLAASQARLKSLANSYPLYSGIDEALFSLGSIYEREAESMRQQRIPEATKERLVSQFEKEAIDAYTRIVTRYPVMNRVGDAKARLAAMKAPVPTPTPEAIAQNRAEESSRGESSRIHLLTANFRHRPDISRVSTVGEPSMENEEIVSAPELLQQLDRDVKGSQTAAGTVGVEVKAGQGPAPETVKPAGNSATPKAPDQINEIQNPTAPGAQTDQPNSASPQQKDDQQDSSSGKKKKKGLRKIIPF